MELEDFVIVQEGRPLGSKNKPKTAAAKKTAAKKPKAGSVEAVKVRKTRAKNKGKTADSKAAIKAGKKLRGKRRGPHTPAAKKKIGKGIRAYWANVKSGKIKRRVRGGKMYNPKAAAAKAAKPKGKRGRPAKAKTATKAKAPAKAAGKKRGRPAGSTNKPKAAAKKTTTKKTVRRKAKA